MVVRPLSSRSSTFSTLAGHQAPLGLCASLFCGAHMRAYETTSLGCNRGRPRLWLQGAKPSMAGFHPGQRYSIHKDEQRNMLILSVSPYGTHGVSKKVTRSGKTVPVIDINSAEVLSVFDGCSVVRVVVQANRICILPEAVEIAKKERLQRLRAKLASGEPLDCGSVSHGGGVLDHALHSGLEAAGIKTRLAFANEIRSELLEQAREHNDIWGESTVPLAAPVQALAFDDWAMTKIPKVEILVAGLPCSGASVAGRAKNGAGHAEAHPEVGHLIVAFLVIIAKANPACVVFENVTQYANSASMCIMRNQLRDFGYEVKETVLKAQDWNVLEHRERLCMVAVTKGLDFDFAALKRPESTARRIAEILDDVAEDSPMWSAMQGLKEKEIRDMANGKNFKMQILKGDSTKCPTITKGYSKVRSTDPKLQHPNNPGLLRQFTAAEHARIKGIPESLIEGLPQTLAHELLGQSICYEPFREVGRCLGIFLKGTDEALAAIAKAKESASACVAPEPQEDVQESMQLFA